MLHLTTAHDSNRAIEARYHPEQTDTEFQVQVFLGSSHHTLYMDVETARDFARELLAVLP